MPDLVYINKYGLLGSNFYWHKHDSYGISKDEILSVGLTDDRVMIHEDLIGPLLKVNEDLKNDGYCIYIKEGYRSRELYELIYCRRVKKFGKEKTDQLLNMEVMPHAAGRSVDVALWDLKENKEILLRRPEDGTAAFIINFYKSKNDPESQRLQKLQDRLIRAMQENGFRLGTKDEYFHFNYKPDQPQNY